MREKYRKILLEPIIGEITQGSIFNGAISKAYPDNKNIYGIIISPRCDIYNRKAPEYYYLPIVKLSDWMKVDFKDIFHKQIFKNAQNKLQKKLRSLNESDSIVGRFMPDEIEKILVKHKVKENDDNFKALSIIRQIDMPNYDTLLKLDPFSTKKNIIEDLIQDKNTSYYFFEDEEEIGYVIRLREINKLSPEGLDQLSKGIDSTINKSVMKNCDLRSIEEKDLFMPIFQVASPYTEHIMQRFLHLFNRIGVDDINSDTKQQIIDIL